MPCSPFPDLLRLAGRCPAGPQQQACFTKTIIGNGGAFLVRGVPGPQGKSALTHLAREYSSDVSFPAAPTNLVNFGEAVNFPLIFGAVLILFGAATLLHVLVLSVTRRRREMGLLRALGFVRRQVALSVYWQTTTVALIGIVIGVPAGIAVGRGVWGVFARSLGVLPVTEVTVWVIVVVAVATLAAVHPVGRRPGVRGFACPPCVLVAVGMSSAWKLRWAALGFALVTGHNSVVAIRENLPGEPFGIRLPISVRTGILTGWGSCVAAPWPMPVLGLLAVRHLPEATVGKKPANVCATLGAAGLVGLLIEPNTYWAKSWTRPTRRAILLHVGASAGLVAAGCNTA